MAPLDPEDFAKRHARAQRRPEPPPAGGQRGPGAQGAAANTAPWPTLDPAALSGQAGRIVETIAPTSEADEAAILMHVLVAAGALLGPGPHARVERTEHPARFFVAIVGKSSKARKGTAWSTMRTIGRDVDPDWHSLLASGLSSGEGLIYCVRDPIMGKDKKGEPKMIDPGVTDKRLLLVESELGGALSRMLREGNSLSAVLRDAWDHGDLRTMTKNSPLRATRAHVSVIGHITEADLRQYLTSTEMANGFGNRFLFCCARRSQLLPHGDGADDLALAPLVIALRKVLDGAATIGHIRRDAPANRRWEEVYPELSRERDGLVGALLARAEAQALRLSVLYALLDQSLVIQLPHLEAALAICRYAEQSVMYLFGGRLGHPVADTILEALRARGTMTRTEISDLFSRHEGAQQIEEALGMIERAGLARRTKTQTGGRPVETWQILS